MTLSSHSKKYVDQFLTAIRPVEAAYCNDTFAYLALKKPNGFVMVQGTLYLNVVPRAFPPSPFESENIRASHRPLSELRISRAELIEQISAGELITPEGRVLFPGNDGNHGAMYQPFHTAGLQTQSRLSVLSLFGVNRENVDQVALDWELRGGSHPFDGLQDLMNEYQIGVLAGGTNTVELIAQSVAAIDAKSQIDGDRATIGIRIAKGLSTDKAWVGFRVLEQGRVVRRNSLASFGFRWTEEADYWSGTTEITVPRAAIVQCTANYAGIAQQYYWLGDPSAFQNPRRAAYDTFDPKADTFKDIVDRAQGRGHDARHFEAAVSWLFWMLGFRSAYLGATPKTQEAADLILCTPNGHFAVVECTTGLLRADNKLPKLHDRAQALRRSLDNSNAKHLHVLPVLVTSKTLEEVRPEIDQAEQNGIYILTRESIDRLLQRTLAPLNPEQLYIEAEQLVSAAIERNKQRSLPGIE